MRIIEHTEEAEDFVCSNCSNLLDANSAVLIKEEIPICGWCIHRANELIEKYQNTDPK